MNNKAADHDSLFLYVTTLASQIAQPSPVSVYLMSEQVHVSDSGNL